MVASTTFAALAHLPWQVYWYAAGGPRRVLGLDGDLLGRNQRLGPRVGHFVLMQQLVGDRRHRVLDRHVGQQDLASTARLPRAAIEHDIAVANGIVLLVRFRRVGQRQRVKLRAGVLQRRDHLVVVLVAEF